MRAIIGQTGGGQVERGGRGTGHVGKILLVRVLALPAERHGRFAVGTHGKGGGVTVRHQQVGRLGAHLRREQARIVDAIQRAAAARQIIERPIIGHRQIQRHHIRAGSGERRERRKLADGLGLRIQHVDHLGKSVHEEVFAEEAARKLIDGRIVKSAARDGAADGRFGLMGVGVHRGSEIRIGRVTLVNRPAVIGAALHLVDLLPRIEAHIIDEQPAGARFESQRVGIAKSQRPDRPAQTGRRVHKRIVRRDRAVPIEPENLAQRTGQRLAMGRDIVLPDAEIQLAIGTERQAAPVVPARFPERGQVQQRHLAAHFRDIPVGRESAQTVVNRRRQRRVIEIHEMIGAEVGIQLNADEAALLIGVDGHGHKRVGQQHPAFDHSYVAPLLAHKHPAIGRHRQRGRRGDAIDAGLAKTRRQQRLRARARDAGQQRQSQQPAAEPADSATTTARTRHRGHPACGETVVSHGLHNS